MYAETLTSTSLTYLPDSTALPYLLADPESVDLAPEVTQLYDLARNFIFFEDQTQGAVIVILDISPLHKGKSIPLRLPETGEAFTSKRLAFNLGRGLLEADSLADSRNAHSTDHREWLRWVSAFYDSASQLEAEADIDLYLIAAEAYRSAPNRLADRAYAHLRWHVDSEGTTFVVAVR